MTSLTPTGASAPRTATALIRLGLLLVEAPPHRGSNVHGPIPAPLRRGIVPAGPIRAQIACPTEPPATTKFKALPVVDEFAEQRTRVGRPSYPARRDRGDEMFAFHPRTGASPRTTSSASPRCRTRASA